MNHLNDEHISYIRKDLHFRGIVLEDLDEELIDHIASAVEVEMNHGTRFIDAYEVVIRKFGYQNGLLKIQQETIKDKNIIITSMLKSYVTLALRHLKKNPMFAFINIASLAVGIAVCILISLLLLHEYEYDRYHERADRIIRITNETTYNATYKKSAHVPFAATSAIRSEFPEVKAATHFMGSGLFFVKRGEGKDNVKINKATWTNNDVFKVFTIPLIEGDPETALLEPNTVVISQRTSEALFKNESPLEQPLILDNHHLVRVVGVYKNFPEQSHVHFELMMSDVGSEMSKQTAWVHDNLLPRNPVSAYVLIDHQASIESFASKLSTLVTKYIQPQVSSTLHRSMFGETTKSGNNSIVFGVQQLKAIHADNSIQDQFEPAFDESYMRILGATAIFMLAIAIINFINLSTARSANRAKEVGMRKVMGSLRIYLLRQFLTESFVLTLFAIFLAQALAFAGLPLFNSIAGRRLQFPWDEPYYYFIMAGGAFLIGIFAGIYPAFFLSAFKPIYVLKGNLARGLKSGYIRSALVVVQFAISIFLVVGTFVLFRQLDFIQNKDIGYKKDQLIVVQETYLLRNQKEAYKNEILKNGIFESGTISGFLPAGGPWRYPKSWWPEGKQNSASIIVQDWWIDHDYITTMGMEIKVGRDFSKEFISDTTAVIINETAARQLGINIDAIGKRVTTYKGTDPTAFRPDNVESFTVIGVVKDFHFASMKEAIGPLVLHLQEIPAGSIVFRFQADKVQEAINLSEQQWNRMAPGEPFTYDFVDQSFISFYEAEAQLGKIFASFTGTALLIASMGLFALVSFTTEHRTKEIGIRKVMGASSANIVALLSKELGKLIMLAFLISVPLSSYAVGWWLDEYVYKVDVGVSVYLIAFFLALIIGWLTISYQSIKAANSNPAISLRTE